MPERFHAAEHKETLLPGSLPAKLSYPLDEPSRVGVTREQLAEVRDDVNHFGKDPKSELPDLMHRVRVIAMGERHVSPNPQRDLGASVMNSLKAAGATHLAIEMDQGRQFVLDKFEKTGKLNPKDLPEKLQTPDYVHILKNARKAGLKISAVDDHFAENFLGITRDRVMAGYVDKILDESPKNKVVFWVGSDHVSKVGDAAAVGSHAASGDGQTAAEILSTKYALASVLAEGRFPSINHTLESITPDLTRPAMIKTADSPALSKLQQDTSGTPQSQYKNYDYVVDFPARR